MKSPIGKTLLACFLVTGLCFADSPNVKRSVGQDGVPVITIKGKKAKKTTKASDTGSTGPTAVEMSQPERPRKAFKVYDLGEADNSSSTDKPTVVVIGNPPPISPNPGSYFYNNGWGFNPYFNGFGPGLYSGAGQGIGRYGFYQNGFVRSVNFEAGVGFRQGFQNYFAQPINYSQPIINYRPAVPVRYTGGFRGFSGFRGCPGRF